MPSAQSGHVRNLQPHGPAAASRDHNPPDHQHEHGVRLVDLARNSHDDLRAATGLIDNHITAPPTALIPLRPTAASTSSSSLSNPQPAAVAALTRKGSLLHSRAKALAAFVPRLTPTTTPPPEKTHSAPNKIFGDLFHGQSAPIRLGAPQSPIKEKEESEIIMDYRSAFTTRPGLLRRRETIDQSPAPPVALSKPSSSWFTRKTANPIPTKEPSDELATLNINSALFPHGTVDPLDPTAFNNLLLNATNLLHRMQTAYREKVDYIASIRPEQEAQQDEVEEAETRATHLKTQLEDMSRRAQEQENTLKEMARELAEERMKSLEAEEKVTAMEAREAAANTIRLVSPSTSTANDGPPNDADHVDEPTTSERRRKRPSSSTASDSGFESDIDSIFSSSSLASPTPESPITPTLIIAPSISRMTSFESRLQINTHQANAAKAVAAAGSGRVAVQRLGREGAAWATVDALRGENRELKRHLAEMQECLQGCIELVSGVDGR
ncbi:hypothetical protein BDY17DRAFT_323444 [Neohortaea acidophila]|uniref:Uncharacterized protein n=1 Tax=Neohortaea acidophila TaxID=245834 RepID=A0A6A6PX43_9PEZI|nr:uncharacterized protein BDY17DRAFT_323444 [Neohortaea acidophila]KAF2484602.1 hypothetical protein BDY17DRAFT_323444 [Neohortaea acidophila]